MATFRFSAGHPVFGSAIEFFTKKSPMAAQCEQPAIEIFKKTRKLDGRPECVEAVMMSRHRGGRRPPGR
jgi:hypothetical protein